MASRAHVHKWKFKKRKDGAVIRSCKCGERILMIAAPHGSSLDGELKELWPKGKHRK